jgi:hypothetical protein
MAVTKPYHSFIDKTQALVTVKIPMSSLHWHNLCISYSDKIHVIVTVKRNQCLIYIDIIHVLVTVTKSIS